MNILNNCLQQQENGFDSTDKRDHRGRKPLIKYNSCEEYIILNGVMRQLSLSGILTEINLWKKSINQDIYSWSTIQRFVCDHPLVVTNITGVMKSGSSDLNSVWAKARLAQCSLWLLHQLHLGDTSDYSNPILPPIYMHGIAFWDEHHKKIILGNSSIIQRRVYHDGNGKFCAPE